MLAILFGVVLSLEDIVFGATTRGWRQEVERCTSHCVDDDEFWLCGTMGSRRRTCVVGYAQYSGIVWRRGGVNKGFDKINAQIQVLKMGLRKTEAAISIVCG
jgi:hypothetical protein